jgi:hypothetical protein
MHKVDQWGLPTHLSERDKHALLYENPHADVIKERKRILNYIPAPCPPDFPEKLKPYWKNHLEFSLTPCQTGWLYLSEKAKCKAKCKAKR